MAAIEVPDLLRLGQPPESPLCTQTCVAMVAGVTVEQAVGACGVTTTNDDGASLNAALRGLDALGVTYEQPVPAYFKRGRKTYKRKDIPAFCIATISRQCDEWRHRVVIKDGFVFDPAWDSWPIPLWHYEEMVLFGYYGFSVKRKGKMLRKPARWDNFLPIIEVPSR